MRRRCDDETIGNAAPRRRRAKSILRNRSHLLWTRPEKNWNSGYDEKTRAEKLFDIEAKDTRDKARYAKADHDAAEENNGSDYVKLDACKFFIQKNLILYFIKKN